MICADGGEWKRRVCSRGCAAAGVSECDGPLQAHHIISQQHLRKHGLGAHRWDTDVGMCLCRRHHVRHDGAVERVAYELIPDAVIRFAFEHGLDYYLDLYPSMEVQG